MNTSLLGDSLEEINLYHVKAYIPVIVFVTVVIVIGFTGNSFAFLFHLPKSSKSTFYFVITVLSFNDGLINLFLIHDSIMLFKYVNYNNDTLCKFAFFVKHLLVANSILFLVVIAVDRYRLICHPFAKQITLRISRYIVIGIIAFSFISSVHYFYTCESVPLNWFAKPSTTGVGYLCFLPKIYPKSTVNLVFQVVDIVLLVFSVVCLIISYTQILRKIVKTRKKLTSDNTVRFNKVKTIRKNVEQSSGSTSHTSASYVDETEDNGIGGKNVNEVKQTTASKTEIDSSCTKRSEQQKARPKGKTSNLCETERRISIMTFVLTVASVVAFVPYFISIPIKPNLDGTTLVFSVLVAFARRSYILNSAINPFVMLYFSTEFRQYVGKALRCACLRK